MDNDPLKKLLVNDSKALDKEKLATFLSKLIVIDSKTKEIGFLAGFEKIESNASKIEAILMAIKAKAIIFEDSDGLTPSEIIKLDVMPVGSVKTVLKTLFDSKKIKKDSSGKYYIPSYRINEVIEVIEKT